MPILLGDDGGSIDFANIWKDFYRVLKDDSFFFLHFNIPSIIKYGEKIEESGFKYKGCVVWNKKSSIGGDLKSSFKKDWEPLFYYCKGKPKFNPVKVMRKGKLEIRNRISEISDWEFSIKKEEKVGHPTQKPIQLVNQVVKLTTSPGDTVLDPFCGSGTIGASCLLLNRRGILMELNDKFEHMIVQRLREVKT